MIRLLVLAALCTSTLASADWLTSTFTINGTFVDLVQLKKTPGIKISGKAVIAQDMYSGHLLVNGKPYECSSVGKGALSAGGREHTFCNMRPSTFLALLNESSIKGDAFNGAAATMVSYFKNHPGANYTTIPVGIFGANGEEVSEYSLHYLEPAQRLTEVDFEYYGSGVTPF